jgi:hypothetical protein
VERLSRGWACHPKTWIPRVHAQYWSGMCNLCSWGMQVIWGGVYMVVEVVGAGD